MKVHDSGLHRLGLALIHDLPASIVVFLVALPLCMGIATASGAPPGMGLITGIIGGIVVGLLAGCPLQVSGPAAGLSVVVWELIQAEGMERLAIIILVAGVIQILAAVLQLGQWFRAVSPAVIQGMLAGIGVLIFASQFHVMIDDVPKGSGIANLLTIPIAIEKGIVPGDDGFTIHHLAAGMGMLTIGVMLLWHWVPATWRVVPGLLVGVGVAAAVAGVYDLPIKYVHVRDNIFTLIRVPDWEDFSHLLDTAVLSAGIAMAFIASAETLLSATAVDQLHRGPRTRYNRELTAQGIGNMLCGLLGALPMTGVMVRSSANIQAGARTRAATVLHGIWLLLFIAFLPFLLNRIPTASLAAVLVFTGYKLVNPTSIKELQQHGKSEVLIYAGTVVTIVATNLLTGVMVGIGLAIAKLVYTTQNLEVGCVYKRETDSMHLEVMGIATFVSLPRLATALEKVPPGMRVRVDFESLRHIDHACLHFLESWKTLHESNGGHVIADWEELKARSYQGRRRQRAAVSTAGQSGAADRAHSVAAQPEPIP